MPRIDAEHRGPLVNLAAWISLVAMIVFLSAKVATKWRMVRKLQNDDILLLLAMVFNLTSPRTCGSYPEIRRLIPPS